MTLAWIPIFGEFEQRGNVIVYKGKRVEYPTQAHETLDQPPEAPNYGPSFGTIICNRELSDGSVSATATFRGDVADAACELIVSFEVESKGQISAGITSASWALFAIREWVAAGSLGRGGATDVPRWVPYAAGGDRTHLRLDKPYHLEVRAVGSRIALYIDGVHVASASLPTRSQPRQVGIWCASYAQVEISDFIVDSRRPQAFAVMQFSEPYNEVYSEVIKEVCRRYEVKAVRADEIYGPGIIIGDVVQQITDSQLVIADITALNANVFFEVGYALALNKPIILLAKRGTSIPFDVQAFRILFYDDSIAGKAKLEEGLRNHLKAILGTDIISSSRTSSSES
jgi:hypothetical protein